MTVPWSKRGGPRDEAKRAEAPKKRRNKAGWLSLAFAPLAAAVRAALRSFLDESDSRLQLSIEEGARRREA